MMLSVLGSMVGLNTLDGKFIAFYHSGSLLPFFVCGGPRFDLAYLFDEIEFHSLLKNDDLGIIILDFGLQDQNIKLIDVG